MTTIVKLFAMNTLIIEDEEFAAEALEAQILMLRPQIRIVGVLASIQEAVEWLEANPNPDLIFCDIHLSDGNSFEIFAQVRPSCPIIFTTAYDQYAIEAFKVNSIDYLLKPLRRDDLQRALVKYEELQLNPTDELQRVEEFLIQQTKRKETKSRFMVRSGQKIKVIPVTEIAYFKAEDGVVLLISRDNKRFVVNYTLDQLEEQLDAHVFFKANRQLLVHIEAVAEVHPYFKGRLQLRLEPPVDEDPVVSSNKTAAFKTWLNS